MSQILHCFALLFIVFVLAEIRNVLLFENPFQSDTITIWEEVQVPKTTGDLTQFKQ